MSETSFTLPTVPAVLAWGDFIGSLLDKTAEGWGLGEGGDASMEAHQHSPLISSPERRLLRMWLSGTEQAFHEYL